MPGLVQRGRKRPSRAISEDLDESSDASSSPSTNGKRARHGGDAPSSPAQTNGDANGSTEGDFKAGSLVRVKLENFVTYTAAEFHLGPSLNMVIGPNGTGKSTLVCAICLGLGWGSEHLGRAKEVGQFVKHGAAEATIEIELATGPGNGPNRIVRRVIRKRDNKSVFFLDGPLVSKEAVKQMARQYSIQIDNLCQFLPQDRVVEFARMSDVDRLRETQRAAAPPQMVAWHDQLKELRTKERALQTKQKNEESHLVALEKAQSTTKDDVDRYHQREGLARKSKCLNSVRPIIETKILKTEITAVKAEIRDARLELDQINIDIEPARRAQAEVETYQNDIEQIVNLRKNRVDMIKTQAEKLATKIENGKAKAAETDNQIKAELSSKKKRADDMVRLNRDITRLEAQRQDQPAQFDAESYEQRKSDLRDQISTNTGLISDKRSSMKEMAARAGAISARSNQLKADRERLNTQSGKQASRLYKLSEDTAKAWNWIQNNKASLQLKGEVFGPPILECSVTEPRYAKAFESQLRKGDIIAITCTNNEDSKMLGKRLLSKTANGGQGFNDVFLRTSLKPLSSYQPPMARAGLAQYGFEGYILDYVKGPDEVLAMLCEGCRLHQIAYAATPLSDALHKVVEEQSPVNSWVSGSETYRVISRYNQSSTSVNPLRPAQSFVDQPGNTDELRAIIEEQKGLVREKEELVENHKILKDEVSKLEEEIDALKQQKDAVQAEQDGLKKAFAEWEALPDKIASKQADLHSKMQENAETTARIKAIKADARATLLQVANLTLEYAKVVTQMRAFHESLVEAEIRLIEVKSELRGLIKENSAILDRKKAQENQINERTNHERVLRAKYRELQEATQRDIYSLSEEERQIVMEYKELPTLEALELELQSVNSRLEMMAEGNPGAIRAYQKREEDIKRTRENLEQYAAGLEEIKDNITEIREKWEPELDVLIQRISGAFAHNFEQIGCAGEVQVNKDEDDFDNWSVQISVRFRENEPLSVLNSHRQSGGERAVSTIFYLMALQDLAQSPFRVVDEINQGMDPRNERMVHERMVDIACQENTSQYFLVTPKLLPGLKYHEKMKVHVINSGEHIPVAQDVKDECKWNLSSMAEIALRVRRSVAVA
ncbi:hypothetical protein J4E93_009325 [Alternaria ventricosa]|uniref:uncharacterized protein n=1 Tax=Alternaria ventricosa TaxID=1187951 RepID=UPI0020C442B0|nr:uncharacterized protein J4E93_009325 [Alternaria ventricosa]KAI4639147.1 hypothetical protein J4E93_009325 [Alternaria ventricosa]